MAEASVAVGVMAVPLWYQRHVIPRPLAVQVTMSSAPNLTVVGESEVVMVGGAIEKSSVTYVLIFIDMDTPKVGNYTSALGNVNSII